MPMIRAAGITEERTSMDTHQFDKLARFFATRRLTRRQALAEGGVGLAAAGVAAAGMASAASAQEATPAADATPVAGSDQPNTKMLFLQSFQSGSIDPKAGAPGTWTLTLEHGLGQTVFFSDRPERIVGATPTDAFLTGFGFAPDNPPNAALLFKNENGEEDISVIELFNPSYDSDSNTATYDIQLLKEYAGMGIDFQEQPTEPPEAGATFGAAHLFIDDCADGTIVCTSNNTHYPCPGDGDVCGTFGPTGYCYDWSNPGCWPCEPYAHLNPPIKKVYEYWINKCNNTFPSCHEGGRESYGCYVSF